MDSKKCACKVMW